jgi:hypothetical protein
MSGSSYGSAERGAVRVTVQGASIHFTNSESEREYHHRAGPSFEAYAAQLAGAADAALQAAAAAGQLALATDDGGKPPLDEGRFAPGQPKFRRPGPVAVRYRVDTDQVSMAAVELIVLFASAPSPEQLAAARTALARGIAGLGTIAG